MLKFCVVCGKPLEGPANKKYCPPCAKFMKCQQTKAFYDVFKNGSRDLPDMTIVNDPDPVGGFFPGAEIEKTCLSGMLRMKSFTPGTLLRGENGKSYKIVDKIMNQKCEVVE